jgi:hypothetical protein
MDVRPYLACSCTSAFDLRDRQYSNSITLSLRRPERRHGSHNRHGGRGMEGSTGFNHAMLG